MNQIEGWKKELSKNNIICKMEAIMQERKNAVFILLGQSNAVGHDLPMEEHDIIKKPLANVFGLYRKDNQSFDNKTLKWCNYTSFGMNLAEEQDNTYSIANCLATVWQEHIDKGNQYNLPNLYIIQIAIGGQGVTEKYMWNLKRKEKLIPGKLGIVDISLFPFSKHIFSLLEDSFKELGEEYEIIGLHWRGGESDLSEAREYLEEHLKGIYEEMFDEFNKLLRNPPIVLHEIACCDFLNDKNPSGECLENMEYVNELFQDFAKKYENICTFDVRNMPQYIPEVKGNGLFKEDMIHFTADVNKEIAKRILTDYAKVKTDSRHLI